MFTLVAALLVHADGRTAGQLALLTQRRAQSPAVPFAIALVLVVTLPAAAGAQASRYAGLGVLHLLLAIALLSGLGIVRRPRFSADQSGPFLSLLAALMVGPLPLVCFALAGISGGGLFAIPGAVLGALAGTAAAVGLPLALAGSQAVLAWPDTAPARALRLVAGALLLLWAALSLRTAFGI